MISKVLCPCNTRLEPPCYGFCSFTVGLTVSCHMTGAEYKVNVNNKWGGAFRTTRLLPMLKTPTRLKKNYILPSMENTSRSASTRTNTGTFPYTLSSLRQCPHPFQTLLHRLCCRLVPLHPLPRAARSASCLRSLDRWGLVRAPLGLGSATPAQYMYCSMIPAIIPPS